MTIERLHFNGVEARFHAYHAAQHVVRYGVVQDLVTGKRVLDVACGEGYGCKLLKDWGASEVVGVDLSKSAIRSAQKHFSDPAISFLQGDAEKLTEVLTEGNPFDVVVSFETIEHVKNPKKFLKELSAFISDETIVAISCPNDAIHEEATQEKNPYHLSKMSFEEFQELTESFLGIASQWLLGAPLNGELNYELGSPAIENGHVDMLSITQIEDIGKSILLPSQSGSEPSQHNCSHYLGLWNAKSDQNIAVSAISVPTYIEPWAAIEYFKTQIADLEEQLKDARSEFVALQKHQTDELEPEIARLTEWAGEQEKTKSEWFEPELERLGKELSDAKSRETEEHLPKIAALEEQLKDARSELETVQQRQSEELEPEIARLTELTGEQEKTKSEWFEPELERLGKELGDAKSRENEEYLPKIAALEEQLKDARRELVALQQHQTDELEPEIARLTELTGEQEKTKSEWFEPELERLGKELGNAKSRETEEYLPKIAALEEQLKDARSELEAMQQRQSEELEPEIARLCEEKREAMIRIQKLERRPLVKELQELRQRIGIQIEENRYLNHRIDKLKEDLETVHREKSEWFDPEIKRLSTVINNYEQTKKEWWDPRIEHQEKLIAEFNERLQQIEAYENSRFYKIAQKYYALHGTQVTGRLLRGLRKIIKLITFRS